MTRRRGFHFRWSHRLILVPSFAPVSTSTNKPIAPLKDGQIVLNQWAADDIGASIGDKIAVTYFEPETTHGSQAKASAEFTIVDIAKLTEPDEPYVVPRRGPIKPAKFTSAPAITNDPDLTPEVPGVTDAESIENWDLPFQTQGLRPQDDEYWYNHRTTPKAFVSLTAGRKIWGSRFGSTTSFRIPVSAGSAEEIRDKLLDQFVSDESKLGLHLIPIKRQGLKASSGSTPFDVLFLALSMFCDRRGADFGLPFVSAWTTATCGGNLGF